MLIFDTINHKKEGLMRYFIVLFVLSFSLFSCKPDPISPENINPDDTTVIIPKVSPLIGTWVQDIYDTMPDEKFSTEYKKIELGYRLGSVVTCDSGIWYEPDAITYVFKQDSIWRGDSTAPHSLRLWYRYNYTSDSLFVFKPAMAVYNEGFDTARYSYKIASNTLFFNYKPNQFNIAFVKRN